MPGKITRYTLTGTLDVTGALTTYSSNPVRGNIKSVQIDYPAATVAVTLSSEGPIAETILTLGAANTDAVYNPKRPLQDNAGSNVTFEGTHVMYGDFIIFGRLKLVCASGTATQVVTVHVLVEEY